VAHSQTLYDSLIGIDCYLFGGIFISYRPERVNWRPINTYCDSLHCDLIILDYDLIALGYGLIVFGYGLIVFDYTSLLSIMVL